MWGSSRYGILMQPSRASAKDPIPLPRTTPTAGSAAIRFLMAKTQSSRRAAIEEGGDCEMGGIRGEFYQGLGPQRRAHTPIFPFVLRIGVAYESQGS